MSDCSEIATNSSVVEPYESEHSVFHLRYLWEKTELLLSEFAILPKETVCFSVFFLALRMATIQQTPLVETEIALTLSTFC